ncbi:cytochrome b [Vibrio gallicus]|uniref:cytochrome b n=1 Tax=Vibrio gallicus TaxID=190897 RepID=UPI0021C48F46|nr:cytochrome b [Vibrio gallicus]
MSLELTQNPPAEHPISSLSKPTILLHWAVAVSFLFTFFVGVYLVDLPRGPEKFELIGLHKSMGVLVLVVALLRIVWRLKEGKLKPASTLSALQQKAASAVHGLLLLATIAMPISGAVMSVAGGRGLDFFSVNLIAKGDKMEGLQSVAHSLHVNAPYLIYAILALHLLAVLKHHLIDKDNTLTRMLGKD